MFNDKYAAVLAKYEKFWGRENRDRCILNISYVKENAEPYRAPASLEEQWLDENYRYASFKHNSTAFFGYAAEGIPMFFSDIGPGCLAESIGGKYELAKDTVWFDKKQYVEDPEDLPAMSFDPKSKLWGYLDRLQNKLAADPDMHFSMADIGGIMDVVASLRGTENLLYDLYDYPEQTRELTKKVKALWFKAFDQQLEAVRKTEQPINNWMNIPSTKPWYALQCDFCYMISPAQFEQFVLEDVADQAKYMDRSIYHLDGVGELPHLDMLLDIPELTGIQWVPGAGEAEVWDEKWFDIYKKIQDKNKNLVLTGGLGEYDMAGAERLIKSIDPRGTYISFGCSSKDKAEEMIERITRWSE